MIVRIEISVSDEVNGTPWFLHSRLITERELVSSLHSPRMHMLRAVSESAEAFVAHVCAPPATGCGGGEDTE